MWTRPYARWNLDVLYKLRLSLYSISPLPDGLSSRQGHWVSPSPPLLLVLKPTERGWFPLPDTELALLRFQPLSIQEGLPIWVNVNVSHPRHALQRCATWFTAIGLARISKCHPFMQRGLEFSCVTNAIKAEWLAQTDFKSFMPRQHAVPVPNHKGLDAKAHTN